MTKIVTFCSFKGGTAKTSSCLHLGAALAKFHRKKVLLIDFDAQANLSAGLGFGVDNLNTMVNVLQGNKKAHEVILNSEVKNLDIIPANVYLDGIESTVPIVGDLYGHERLRKALLGLDQYDFIFIDTPPSLGWLTQSALFAAHYSLICAVPEAYSILALDRLRQYHLQIQENHPIELVGVVLSFWSDRGATNDAFVGAIDLAFPEKLFKQKIRRDVAISRAVLKGMPVFEVTSNSRASDDFKLLSKEFLTRVKVGVHV
ncbi:MAG: ParA family protein [Rhabdochlamydiaceae bacterium]|nr:ParA family protein [Candidatus Amphrikana amoebophyrae]